jgi:glycosyltransferase involved in cell wall biosynthesis
LTQTPPLRVLHVIGPTEVGGAQTQLLGILRVAEGGLWRPALCSTAAGPLLPAFRDLSIPVLDLRRRASPGLLRVRALRQHLRTNRYDVVHGTLPHASATARLALPWTGRPAVVVSERDVEPRTRSRAALERVLFRVTDLYLANSEAVAEALISAVPAASGRVRVIPNAVDRTVFFPAPARPGAAPRVGAVGRLSPEKGLDVLISAARMLASAVPEVQVLVAGDGPGLEELQVMARDTPVRFVGPLEPGAAVADFLRSLDVFVLPSRREGRPNALLEAQACGLPVVASDIPAVRGVVGRGSRLVPPGDAHALAEALRLALSDPGLGVEVRLDSGVVPSFPDVAALHLDAFRSAMHFRSRS